MAGGHEDPYKILGVSPDASADEIKQAYRKLALKWHPDRNPSNKQEAEATFKQVSRAYSLLSNPEERQQYDYYARFHGAGSPGAAGSSQPGRYPSPGSPASAGAWGPPPGSAAAWSFREGRSMSQEEAYQTFREAFGGKPLHEVIRDLEEVLKQQEKQMAVKEEALRDEAIRLRREVIAIQVQMTQERSPARLRALAQMLASRAAKADLAEQALAWSQIQRTEQQLQSRFAISRLRSLDPLVRAENTLRKGLAWGAAIGAFVVYKSLIYAAFTFFTTSLAARLGFTLLRRLRGR